MMYTYIITKSMGSASASLSSHTLAVRRPFAHKGQHTSYPVNAGRGTLGYAFPDVSRMPFEALNPQPPHLSLRVLAKGRCYPCSSASIGLPRLTRWFHCCFPSCSLHPPVRRACASWWGDADRYVLQEAAAMDWSRPACREGRAAYPCFIRVPSAASLQSSFVRFVRSGERPERGADDHTSKPVSRPIVFL